MEMMKERFAKLLLGEDMSGCGKGVCPALSISNAITNLCGRQQISFLFSNQFHLPFIFPLPPRTGSVFGQIWRLEPLAAEKKTLWRREMEWLLCVSDYIVELTPSVQNFPDGTKLEVFSLLHSDVRNCRQLKSFTFQVMSCRQRSDLFIDLPALRKLDNMLLVRSYFPSYYPPFGAFRSSTSSDR